jgi:cytochrome c oxidase subunit 1
MATVTEALPRTHAAPYSGIWEWITTVDHKKIGVMYGSTALVFFVIAGLEAAMIRLQLWAPGLNLVDADQYNGLFTMHGTSMIFLAIMPFAATFFNFVVPLQIGARDVAFPRLNAFSYWAFLFGGLLLNSSFLFHAPADAGWFSYAPLSMREFSGLNQDFWVLSLQILGVASLAAAFNFLVTIINMRCPGMTLMRMPLFTWMTFVTVFLIVLAFPVITVALTEMLFDRFFGTNFFRTAAGADSQLWQHLFWVFGHPEVYILILPPMGIVSDVLPTFSKKPLFGYPVVVYSGVAIAFLSFGVWAHHMFSTGMGALADAIFAVNTMLIAVPTGVKIFNWIGTMWGGSIRFTTSMQFAIGFVAMFIIGGLSGVSHASPPSDLQQTDTYYIVAHFHYVLFGGAMFGLFAGAYYWFPKITGRLMSESLGSVHFWLTMLGFNLTFMPMHWSGMLGMPRRTHTYAPELNVTWLNQLSTIGALILVFSVLIFLINLIRSAKHGQIAGGNPWDAGTLEWSIPSPPPEYNFAEIPVIHKRDPLWPDEHEEAHGVHATEMAIHGAASAPLIAGQEGDIEDAQLLRTEHGGEHPDHGGHGGHGIHMPNPSYYPLVSAAGLATIFIGLMITPAVSLFGLAALLWGIFGWCFEPAG